MPLRLRNPAAIVLMMMAVVGCKARIAEPSMESRLEIRRESPTVTFAVIGDYGLAGTAEAEVARLVDGWEPEIILTLGDNNYPSGQWHSLDENVGQYYHRYISPYSGAYGEGAPENRFFPTLGNHDWRTRNISPYLEYFQLPGNERYYNFVWGPVEFFAVDSDSHEPHGNDAHSTQARWLRDSLEASKSPWQVVYMHHAPFSSGKHGSVKELRWPYHAWGADVVLAGHDHHYERLMRDDGPYIVNGLGGNPHRYPLRQTVPGSVIRYNDAHGAIRGRAEKDMLVLEFITTTGDVVDQLVLRSGSEP